jgi:serine/threonine-protein kinase
MAYDTAVVIGSGGMGEVYKAWDSRLERWVALKYLRHDDPELVERLLREARAQARIDHPGICQVYEVGEEEGRPFIAMQYVEGKLLNEMAEELTLEQKALVLKQVAEAVQAAHAEGLIHRDLKPSNIIVAEEPDGGLRPYVLDFGIAREQELSGLTLTGQILGTPGYLSPEQARGEVSTLDRRTDVFSLGVILYELLAGVLPFPGDSKVDILVGLLEHEPAPLRKLVNRVPRDLETVVATCLEKEPDQRYPSAQALVDDLERFLAGEPVQARPLSRWRLLLRRARKHRLISALAVIAATIIMTLLVVLVLGWVRYTRELEQKELEAREIADFLVGIFEISDPARHNGETITAREVLEQGAAKVDQELEQQPLARARLLNAIAEAFARLGLYQRAYAHAQTALKTRQELLGENHLLVAESLLINARICRDAHYTNEAERLYREALAIHLTEYDEQDPAVAGIKVSLAECLAGDEQLDEADRLSSEGLAALQQAFDSDHSRVLTALQVRAMVLRRRGEFEAAEKLYLELLQRQRRALGDSHQQVSVTLNSLAILLRHQDRLAEAEQRYREALAITEQIYGKNHPNSMQVLANLSYTLSMQGKLKEMVQVYRDVVSRAQEHYPDGHWRLGLHYVSLGRTLINAGQMAAAEPELRTGLEIYQSALGRQHPWTAFTRGFLAASLLGQGRAAEAEELVQISLADLAQAEELNAATRSSITQLAEILEQLGEHELAGRYRRFTASPTH